jgi:ABC-type dipeptide/oligopeptide/nickel transport system permease subunit
MSQKPTIESAEFGLAPRVGETKRFIRVFLGRGLVIFGGVIVVLFVITAIFGPLFAPYPPNKLDAPNRLQGPSSEHWLGTDDFGRDSLSRLIHGSGNSLLVGVVAVGIAAIIGIIAGMLAGYYGGIVNAVIMRIIDALMAFPMILLALLIAGLLGNGLRNVMIALGIALIPGYARLMCGQVLQIRENDYVLAGRSMGSGNWRLMLRHILPNAFPPLIVLITMQIGAAILAEAGLSYLGIGITPPDPSWGAMVNNGFKYLLTDPLLSFIPGIAIMLVVFAFSMVGDGLRDALDPRLRGTL